MADWCNRRAKRLAGARSIQIGSARRLDLELRRLDQKLRQAAMLYRERSLGALN
jgi:hypothetical protein